MRATGKVAAVSLLIVAWVHSAALAQKIEFDPATMMSASEVRPGMRGIGKSVFRGVEIKEFEFEVVGRLEKMVLGRDIILAQITGGPPIDRNAGVIGGMSGSPCYIKGRLLGALAYGWYWQKEAMFGITPIEDMLEATWRQQKTTADAPGDRWIAREPIRVYGHDITGAVVASVGGGGPFADSGTIRLEPVTPPVTCSGMGPQAMRLMADRFEPHGLTVLAGPGTKSNPVAVDLQPGAAAGVRLMTGDFEASAVGTVTYRQGDQLLAFGHPFMQLGAANLPICTGWIHDVMPSIQRSSKIGSGMTDVGTMYGDMPWSIAARLGDVPRMVPATFRMIDRCRNITNEFKVSVCDQPKLTSAVLAAAMVAAVEATFNTGYEGTAKLHYKIVGQKGDTVERSNTLYFQESAIRALMPELAFPMYLLEENRFRPQNIASLEVTAEFDEQDNTAMIERVYTDENIAKAGESLHLHVVMRPDAGEIVERVVKLDIPIETPKGALMVVVASGELAWMLRSYLHLLMPAFNDLDSFIRFYEKLERNTDLTVIAALPSTGIMVGDTRLMRLPGSIEALVTASPRTDLSDGKAELSHTEACPWIIYGGEFMAIPVADRQGAKGTKGKKPSDMPQPPAPALANAQTTDGGYQPSGAVAPIKMYWAADAFPEPVASEIRQAEPEVAPPPPPGIFDLPGATRGDGKDTKPEAKNGEEKEETPDKEETKAKGALTVRQLSTWTQTAAEEFLEGKLEGVAVRSDGVVTLAPYVQQLDALGEFYVLSAAADEAGNVYLGTGSEGHVYKVDSDRKTTLFCDIDCFAITGLMCDGKGGLLATTAPGGKVYNISAEGKASVYCELPADYLWDIGKTAQGNTVVCTGAGGRLYELQGAGKYREICRVAQAHILCVAADDTYTYLGTAGQGVVYRLSTDGSYTALFDAKDADITAITVANAGQQQEHSISVATASDESGCVYQIAADGTARTLYQEKETPIYSLACMDGALYAGTGGEGKLVCIVDENQQSVAYTSDNVALTCMQPLNGRQMYIGTANQGSLLYVDTARATEGVLESSVLDAKRVAQWGLVEWQAKTAGHGTATVSTRSGSSSDPTDKSWSTWSRSLDNGAHGIAASPPARYLQYRLELARAEAEDVAEVSRVSIAYLPANQEPTVRLKKPSEGEVVSGEYTVSWDASDPDKDTLTTTLYYRQLGQRDWIVLNEEPEEDTYDWKTSAIASGVYQLRIVVSDEASNPGKALSDTAVLELLTVDNDDPKVWVDTVEPRDGKLYIAGVAADELSKVAEVCYRLDGRWHAALAVDGLYDSRYENFEMQVPLPEKKTRFNVRVRDAAGNESTVEVTWPDSQKPAPPE